MKVIDKNLLVNFESYRKTVNEKQDCDKPGLKNSAPASCRDRVALSPQAEQIREATGLIRSIPDVREEKIARIKGEIEQNTYKVDAQKLADKMLKDALEIEIAE